MPRTLLVLALLLLPGLASAGEDADGKKKPMKRQPEPGIHWEPHFEQGMLRAAHEGRPILFCINALENESANVALAKRIYRSAPWGMATRGYVTFACNPNEHDGADGFSTRYPGTRSATAQAALRYVMQRFGNDLISPQHIILEPDGDLAYRKPFYEGVVGPALLDDRLARISPPVAYSRAAISRESDIEALAQTSAEDLATRAKTWLASNDGLAVVGILNALDDEFDPARRLTLIHSLRTAAPSQAPAVAYGAEERTSYPEDEPGETLAWLAVLFSVDRSAALPAASRALARSTQASQRDAVLRVWAGTASTPTLSVFAGREAALVIEALLLAGDDRVRNVSMDSIPAEMKARVERARLAAGLAAGRAAGLAKALRHPKPGVVREALVAADANEVATHREWIIEQLRNARHRRVRVAAALALLRVGDADAADEVGALLAEAVFDPITGPDARREAVERLGDDFGESPGSWAQAVSASMKEAR